MKKEFQLTTFDGLKLSAFVAAPENPKAVIVHIHGMGEHYRRYFHVFEELNHHNYAVLTVDLRGHGASEGRRGHTPSYEALMTDVGQLKKEAVALFPNLPIIFYGHSMGGNLVLNYLIRKEQDFSAAIVTSPYLRLAFEPPAWKVTLGKFSAKLLPTLAQSTGLDVKQLAQNEKVSTDYQHDKLVHDKITSSFFVNVHFAGPFAIENATKIKIPLFLAHGTKDGLTDHKASIEFKEKSGENVTLHLEENGFHELHNDTNQVAFINRIINWLNERIK